MQRVALNSCQIGMVVARNIYSANGQLLLGKGSVLTGAYIRRLREMGIMSVFVESTLFKDIEAPDVISEETRNRAIQSVQASLNSLRVSGHVNVEQFRAVAKSIVDEIMGNPQAIVHLTDIRAHDDYTFSHSVSVCVLAVLTAMSLGYSHSRLADLAVGALLHDAGKMLVPKEILNKPGRLTDEEFAIMKKHAELGFGVLRKRHNELSVVAAHVAYQHHEKYGGGGYPRGLKGEEIHEFARVTAIADVYDAVTSERPYRKAMLPHEAYEMIMGYSNTYFDAKLLKAFTDNIALYPVGTMVRLNTGETGIVVAVPKGMQHRPKVRIVLDPEGRPCSNREIDLTQHLTTFISEVLCIEDTLKITNAEGARH